MRGTNGTCFIRRHWALGAAAEVEDKHDKQKQEHANTRKHKRGDMDTALQHSTG